MPFYLLIAEPTARVAKSACREVARLEHQLRDGDVFYLVVLMIVVGLMDISAGDSSMFKVGRTVEPLNV
jgi:hypothetical protein